MKHCVYFLMFMVALSFAACGKNDGGGGGSVAAVPGIGPTGPYVNINTCQVGQIYSVQYGCLVQGSCPVSFGYVPATQQCAQGIVVTTTSVYGSAASAGRFYGTMAVSNPSQFALLLKYSRLCDPYWVGWNFGSWNCNSWANQGFIQLQFFASGMAPTNVTMYVGAGQGLGGNYAYSMSSQGSIGFSQQARVMPANVNAGMYIDGVGPDGSSVGIKLLVNTGNFVTNPALSTFTADVMYQNVKFATVTFTRY